MKLRLVLTQLCRRGASIGVLALGAAGAMAANEATGQESAGIFADRRSPTPAPNLPGREAGWLWVLHNS